MRSSHQPQSTTSLPRAPRDEASARFIKYSITMTIRVVCFVLMVVVTPYSWYTWIFAIGAVFLPYIAVVIANVGLDRAPTAISPERAIEAHAPAAPAPSARDTVIRITETPGIRPTGARPAAASDASEPGDTASRAATDAPAADGAATDRPASDDATTDGATADNATITDDDPSERGAS